MRNVARSFVKDGIRYFVLTKSYAGWRTIAEGSHAAHQGEEEWLRLKELVFSHWQPHDAFFTFSQKAHVAALRPHLENRFFAVIDLHKFFDHVTRAKVFRALEAVGFSRSKAFKLAGESTIRQADGKYTLPRGFRQSSLLAALVLDRSLLGSTLRSGSFESKVTVYADDIIFSSTDAEALADEHSQAISLLSRSHFPVNASKTQTAAAEVTVFNIRMSHGHLRFTDERMWRFFNRASLLVKSDDAEHCLSVYDDLFGDYIRSINPDQEKQLRKGLGFL
jgi:hypothetical protein